MIETTQRVDSRLLPSHTPSGTDLAAELAGSVTDQQLLVEIRARVAPGRFELRHEPDGYVWQTPEQPVQSRRVFATASLALRHADTYTRYWSNVYRGAAATDAAL